MDLDLIYDLTGWAGAVILLVAYGMVSTRRLAGDSATYQLLNLVGGVCLLLNTYHYGAFPSVGVNLFWIGIAVHTLSKRKTRPSNE